jgi:hypothetical protein
VYENVMGLEEIDGDLLPFVRGIVGDSPEE